MTLLELIADDCSGPFEDDDSLWLHCYQQNPLLRQQPLLLLLLQYYAEKQHWSHKQCLHIAMLPDVDSIFQQLALPFTEHSRWLCQQVTRFTDVCEAVQYAPSELKTLYCCFQNGYLEKVDANVIQPSVEWLIGLAKLLSKYPELATARFIKRSRRNSLCFDIAEFKLLKIKQAAKQLGHPDILPKLLRCRHLTDLNGLQHRLEDQVSDQLLQSLATVDLNDMAAVYDTCQPYLSRCELEQLEDHWYERYPELPWARHEQIIQLNDFQELFLEAHQQHNCALTYRADIAAREYAIFRILAPERATLGLKWHPKKQRFQLDELVAKNNHDVSNTTRRILKRWLKQSQP